MAIKREAAEDLYDTFENLYKQSLEGQSIDLELITLGRLEAVKIKDAYITACFDLLLGIYHFKKADYPEAVKWLSIKPGVLKKNDWVSAEILVRLGRAQYIQGKFTDAIANTQAAITLLTKMGDEKKLSNANDLLAGIFLNMGFFEEALQLYDACHKYYIKQNMHKALNLLCVDLGNTYKQLKKYDTSEKYFFEAIKIGEEHPELMGPSFVCNAYKHLAELYLEFGEAKKASVYIDKIEKHDFKSLHPFLQGTFYLTKCQYFQILKQPLQAVEYGKLAVDTGKRLDSAMLRERGMFGLGQSYLLAGDLKKAETIFLSALKSENTTCSDWWQSEAHKQLMNVYKLKGNLTKAIHHLEIYQQLTEKYKYQEIDSRIAAIKSLNEMREKQKYLMQTENELALKKQELDMATLFLNQKANLLNDLETFVTSLRKENAQKQKIFTSLLQKLKTARIATDENSFFKEKISDSNRDFIKALRLAYPEITKEEADIAALLKKGLNTKEIAAILILDKRAIEQHRYRLRKKMGLKRSDDLALALSKI